MARKNVTIPFKISSAQSLATNFTSPPMNADYMDNVGIIIDCTGITDNMGVFTVEARFVPAQGKGPASAWGALTLDIVPTLANIDEVMIINLNQFPYSEFRISFAAIGGTPDGVCDIWYGTRQVGG